MAPSARTVHKAEAKYGVTADYPDLQLHAAAANGNVGLVKYALMHGQPVNSVLNGVLPIHIAASSGSDLVVQMLIDAGADVNAARLPRKYNADRSKAISSIGAAGSTPLHFAAANGHAHIVSLLLSHGANPDATEKHGLKPEDLAREAGHLNVVTVFRLWKQDANNQQTRQGSEVNQHSLGDEFYSSPPSASGSGYSGGGGGKLASSAASIHSVASTTGRKLLSKPSLDSISNKGKKLAKAASNPNLAGLLPNHSNSHSATSSASAHPPPYVLASSFAQPQVALRQNPSKALANYMQNHPNAPLIHHVINLDKSRRPSLPSVFEKAAHPSQSIKSALGLSSHSSSSRLGSRGSSSGNDHDPYNLSRPHRSSSKTSLTGIFKPHHLHNKERSAESYNSQPLSPAASTFFTGDDELEQAERDMFMRNDASSGDELGHAPHPFTSMSSPRPGSGSQDHNRRTSMDGFSSVRSRAGSASSAATSQSNLSYAPPRMSDGRSLSNYPMTAPPTQTTFTNFESEGGQLGSTSRPTLSAHTSTGSIVIPQPIPPPPSSSTQPFFSKAAISAAHTNAARPGFYRPRKSSQLSTAASTVSSGNYTYSPDPDNRSLSHQSRSGGGSSDAEASSEGIHDNTLVPPALVVRRPTIRDGPSSQGPMGDSNSQRNPQAASPRQAAPEFLSNSTSPPPSLAFTRTSQANASNGSRHVRTASDGTGGGRQLSVLPDVQESPESQLRASSQELPSPSRSASREPGATDRNERRESEDIFPPNAEAPFPARSRAGSRARLDSAGSSNGPVPHLNLTSATGSHHSPTLASISSLQYQNQTGGDVETQWKTASRTHRSDSTTTDTRTSRSGSLGESGGPHQRFFGFDYSSSPTGSTASFKYHPSASTTATSLVSSPPGTAISSANHGTTVTHAQAQNMVKRKEEELLSYDPSETSEGSSARRPSLSQQLAAYGDSLAIERELHDAERHRQHPHERIALTIPEPPASAKYSWEILGKETRTNMPVSKGQRAREIHDPPSSVVQQQKLWTHRMVSPYEVPLNRPGTHAVGHRHTPSSGTITSSGKPLGRVVSNEMPSHPRLTGSGHASVHHADHLPSIPQSPALPAVEPSLRNKPSSTLSLTRGYLAPPQQSGGSDLSVKKSPRVRSISPSYTSPRSSSEREREKPSAVYHVVAGPSSEATDSANSSLISEPRSGIRGHSTGSNLTIGSSRHRSTRSDPPSASPSPDASHVNDEQTPRPPQLLRLETVMAPKFHIEQKAGGEAAPSPTKAKFGSKFGKLFR